MSYGHRGAVGDVRVIVYGVPRAALHKGLAGGTEGAIEQMRCRVALWNRLVEIDQAIRAEQEPILAPYRATPERPCQPVPAEAKAQLRAIAESFRETVNAACRESGCWWCNYAEVKVAWETARKRPDPPRFHRWDGTGKTIAFLAYGLPVAAAFGDDTRLRIRPGARDGDALISLRVGSEGRAPIWLTLPVRLHRPLPADGLIRSVAAVRELIAGQERWSIHCCVERSVGGWQTHMGERAGRIALDLGWRTRPDGLRVVTWQNDAGQTDELVLPEWHIWAMQKVADLQSIRDNLWNQTIASLSAWVKARDGVPEWLREAAGHWHLWRRKGRLVRLYAAWREQRFPGDEVGFAIVDTWLQRDRHLWEWAENLRDQALRRRREFYRVFAADLARRYREVILEDFDLSDVARRKEDDGEPGPAADLVPVMRRNRQWAALYEVRHAIVSACRREGVTVTVVPATDTTVTCAACGIVDRFDKRELIHRCAGCGAVWDQDENACSNLLKSGTSQ